MTDRYHRADGTFHPDDVEDRFPGQQAICPRGCGANVIWRRDERDDWQLLDPDHGPDGDIRLRDRDGAPGAIAEPLTGMLLVAARESGEALYRRHVCDTDAAA